MKIYLKYATRRDQFLSNGSCVTFLPSTVYQRVLSRVPLSFLALSIHIYIFKEDRSASVIPNQCDVVGDEERVNWNSIKLVKVQKNDHEEEVQYLWWNVLTSGSHGSCSFSSSGFSRWTETEYKSWLSKKLYVGKQPTRHQSLCWSTIRYLYLHR